MGQKKDKNPKVLEKKLKLKKKVKFHSTLKHTTHREEFFSSSASICGHYRAAFCHFSQVFAKQASRLCLYRLSGHILRRLMRKILREMTKSSPIKSEDKN